MTAHRASDHPAPSPEIANPHAVPLTGGVVAVLSRLFAGYARVVVEGELGGGFSDARILKVTPFRGAGAPDLPAIVKIGPADLIRREFDAYGRYIRGRLSGIPEVWGEPVYGGDEEGGGGVVDHVDREHPGDEEGGAFGGLRYGLVGDGLFDSVSLARYAETARPEDLAYVLDSRLFVHLGTIWRQSRRVEAPLGSAYGAFVRPGLADFFGAALAGSAGAARGDATGDAPAALVDLSAPTVSASGAPGDFLPNPLAALPAFLAGTLPHRIATIHGDLNLDNVLVDPGARTVRLIDFSESREDHVLHDLLRLETGLVTRLLAPRLAAAGLVPSAVVDLYRRLHTAADTPPPGAALRTVHIGLVAVRAAAIRLLADPADWREYFVGLAAYLVGAGKYRNLDGLAKATAFWAAAAALDLARAQPRADLAALGRAIPVLLRRNPVLEAYRRDRIAEWSGPRYDLDERFVELSLLVDQGEEAAGGRWQARERRYASLGSLIDEVPDPALVVLGSPGSGKSTLLRRLELEAALAGIEDGDRPLTFFLPLNHYRSPAAGRSPSPGVWLAAQWSARFPGLPPLEALLAEGRMILLLDALNEIPAASAAEAREQVLAWKDFAQELAATAPGSRVVFSCRSLDYATPLSSPALRVPQVRIEPLSDRQVRQFLAQYAPTHAEGLWSTLAASGQVDVVRSPYFLRLLVEQAEATGDVPLGRAALFTGFVRRALVREVERDHPLFQADTLLATRDVHRLTVGRGWRTPYELPERGVLVPKLAELAYRMQERSEIAGEQAQVRIDFDTALALVDHARDADIVAAGAALGVLDEDPGQDEVLFVHQLVQEYFAARALARAPRPELVRAAWRAADIAPGVPDLIATLPVADALPPLAQSGWEETALLAAAMTADVEAYVRAIADVNLALAGRCASLPELRAAPHGRSPLREPFLADLRWALVRRSREPEADLRHRIACGHALGELGDPRFERRVGPHGAYLMPPLVDLPGGRRTLGSDIGYVQHGQFFDDAAPAHAVEIAPLAIGRFAVTNAEWACFMAAGGYEDERWWGAAAGQAWRRGEGTAESQRGNNRLWRRRFRDEPALLERMFGEGLLTEAELRRWQGWVAIDEAAFEVELAARFPSVPLRAPRFWRDSDFNNPLQPVVGISWHEASAYARWLAAQSGRPFRLPAEAEWEAAARGPEGRPYAFGTAFDASRANALATRVQRPTPVGVFPEGDTPAGVADLCGNVYEWTSSAWGEDMARARFGYPYDPHDGREDPTLGPETLRVVRGGGWCNPAETTPAWVRQGLAPAGDDWDVGFRLAVSASWEAA